MSRDVDVLPPLKPNKLVRKPVIRRTSTSNIISNESLKKVHDDSNRRISQENDDYFERLRRATIKNDKNEISSGKSVLEKIKQNSRKFKRIDMSQASRTVASQLNVDVSEEQLLREALNSVVHRMGQGNVHFENRELYDYIGTAFKKSTYETDNIIRTIEEESASEHTLSIELESAQLKEKIKNFVFCSMTVLKKKKDDPFYFSMCTDNNTCLSTTRSSEQPLWDDTLTIPLETARGSILIVAVWKTKQSPAMSIVLEDKKCLGFVQIDLNAQPTTGSHESWTLISKKGKEKGSIQFGLKYNLSVGKTHNAVMVHAGLLSKFISVDVPKSGSLTPLAGHILELQKIQQNISVVEVKYSDWLVRSKLCLKTNTMYERLHAGLQQLIACLNKPDCQLSSTHQAHLFITFTEFQAAYVEKMKDLNSIFPYTSESSIVDLKYLTKCYLAITKCGIYASKHARVVSDYKQELDDAFKVNVSRIIQRFLYQEDPECNVIEMTKKVKECTIEIRIELRNEKDSYVPSLEMTSFTDILLREINEQISKQTRTAVEIIMTHLKSITTDFSPEQEDLLNEALALYVTGSDLKKLCEDISGGSENPITQHFHHWFYNIIEKWLLMVQNKQKVRVKKAVLQLDSLERIDMHITWSSSIIDVETMNENLAEVQQIFDFPDESSRFAVVHKLNKVICDSTVQACELLFQRGDGLFKKTKRKDPAIPEMELLKKSMVILSSIDKALDNLRQIPVMLNWGDKFTSINSLEKLRTKLNEAKADITNFKAEWMIQICSNVIEPKFVKSFKRYIELLYKGNKDAIEELLDMLADELNKIVQEINRTLSVDLLRCVWERVILPRFEQHICTKPQKIQSYYDNLQAGFQDLSGWFITEAEELTAIITQSRAYRIILFKLQNLTISLEKLFFRYYVEEMINQKQQINTLGTITFSACIASSVQNKSLIKVRVIECKNLPQMDTLTQCDAQVRLVLEPRHAIIFKHLKVQKTKTIRNDLNPVFNEQFEFALRVEENDLEDGCCLQMTVWDKDRLSADDFVGEVLLNFKEIPQEIPATFTKPLALPDLSSSFCFDVLDHRQPYERVAKKFVSERYKMVNKVGDNFTIRGSGGSDIFNRIMSQS